MAPTRTTLTRWTRQEVADVGRVGATRRTCDADARDPGARGHGVPEAAATMAAPKKRPGTAVRTELVLLMLAIAGIAITLVRSCGA